MSKHTTNLRPEVALALADLMDSGEFGQCKGKLRRDGNLCAEGMLCELFRRRHDRAEWIGDRFCAAGGGVYQGSPPREVCRWATGEFVDPRINDASLGWHNDHGRTFPELSRMLREAAGGGA